MLFFETQCILNTIHSATRHQLEAGFYSKLHIRLTYLQFQWTFISTAELHRCHD